MAVTKQANWTAERQMRVCNSLADYWTRLVNNLNEK